MAIDFPNSPNNGDVHSDGGASWRWSGYAWRRIPDPGAKGEPGSQGDKGEVGLTGNQGDKGDKGAPSTVAGPQGIKGDTGDKGASGSDGDKGEKGEPSTVKGDKGDQGEKGGTGAGTKGEKGAGSSVTIGVSPPTSPTPAPGDMWWDSDDSDLHVYYNDGNSAQWVSVTSSAALKGQTGDKGEKGAPGQDGQDGDKGAQGAQGIQGNKGDIGPQGGSGGVGDKGDEGEKGAPGESGSIGIPSGFIGIWSGAANAIPSGWYLCNGSNGTPDLRDRFVVGAGSGYSVGNTGGSASVTLSTANLPSHSHGGASHNHTVSGTTGSDTHNHTIQSATSIGGGSRVASQNDTGNTASTQNDTHSHSFSANTNTQGSSATNANLPPYYALCYIMKS